MFRRFSSLLQTATLVTVALFPAGSTAQTMPGYGGSKDNSTKTSSSAAQTTPGNVGSQGYGR